MLLRGWPCFVLYVLTCCLVSASPFAQNQILNQMASPPTSIARKRPISATSKSQTGMDLTSASGELSSHVYGSWETGGGSLVRPESAPPERRTRVIDKRGGSRRDHTTSKLQACAAGKPPELDFLLETLIDLEEVDATEHAQAGARSGQHWGDIGAKLGSIAQAAARQHNRGKGRNERNRQTLEDSRVAERRVAVGKPKISGSREEAFAWQTKSVAKSGELHYESHYQRALEEHSSPARLRVRVTVKKPMVVSLSSLPYSWCLVDLAHGIIMPLPRYESRSIMCVILTGPLASSLAFCISAFCIFASGAGGLSHSNNTTATD